MSPTSCQTAPPRGTECTGAASRGQTKPSGAAAAASTRAAGHWVSAPAVVRARSFPGRKRATLLHDRLPVF